MMSIHVDWNKLRHVYQDLIDYSGLTEESDIIFIMILGSGKAKKSIIKFKDFMHFFWALSENDTLTVATLIAQDKEGRILYRHKRCTNGNEQIPDGGNAGIIQHWNALMPEEKTTFLSVLMSQIQGYEQ